MQADYTNAPATKLVATHCCACGRPLLCAESVRTGIGPVCAERYGVSQALRGTADCKRANALIYQLAAHQKEAWGIIAPLLAELQAIPAFGMIADRIEERLAPTPTIEITVVGHNLRVVAPFVAAAIPAFRAIPGRRFGKETVEGKEVAFNLIPVAQKKALLGALTAHYKGHTATGPKGLFVVA